MNYWHPASFIKKIWSRKPAARSVCVLHAKHVLRSHPMEAFKCRAEPKIIGRLPLDFMKFSDTQCMKQCMPVCLSSSMVTREAVTSCKSHKSNINLEADGSNGISEFVPLIQLYNKKNWIDYIVRVTGEVTIHIFYQKVNLLITRQKKNVKTEYNKIKRWLNHPSKIHGNVIKLEPNKFLFTCYENIGNRVKNKWGIQFQTIKPHKFFSSPCMSSWSLWT
jgi:hypothetical protein